MTSESDNPLPTSGTDNAQPSTEIDNPKDWNYYDPDDDQDNVKPAVAKGTEGETNEVAESDQEIEQSDENEEPEGEENSQESEQSKAPKDTVTVEMPDGSKLSLAELKNGYSRQSDYTRKAQELANHRQEFAAFTHHQQNNLRAAQAFLQSILPPRPDTQLAYSNPAEFIAMKAHHDSAVERLQQSQAFIEHHESARNNISEAEQIETLERQKELLFQALPNLKSDKARAQFRERINEVGQAANLSPQEIDGVMDHRYYVILDLATEGLAARKARQTAKTKVAGVPPVVPQKRGQTTVLGVKNRDAMRSLSKSGSIKDAMMVDFD
jgi:hypothetical protein